MKRWYLAFGLVVIPGSGAMGQEVRPLTLEEAIAISHRANPANRGARARVDAATATALSEMGRFLPTVNASMTWSGASNTQTTGTDDFGQTVQLPTPVTFRSSSASQRISSSIRIFDGFQNVNRLRAARSNVDAAWSGVDVQRLQTDADVAQRFFDALRYERLIRVETSLLAAARERLDANERLFRVAAASQVDVLGAQVDVAGQQQRLDLQRGEARKARLRVLEALGVLNEMEDFRPVGAFPAVFDPARLDRDHLVAAALEANPLVRQRQMEVAAAHASSRAAHGSWLPTVDLSAGWGRGLNSRGFGAFFDVNPRQDRGYNFSMTVRWQLFSGFQRSQQIGQASSQRQQAEENLRAARLQVEQQVRAALIDLENRYQALQIQERSTTLSRTRVELAREQYRSGSIVFTNLQQIIQTASNEERALVEAEYNLAVALVRLEQQVGRPVQPE